MNKKTCADCANVQRYTTDAGKQMQVCETYGWGMPVDCAPPYDEPCHFFSETEKHDDSIFEKIINAIQENMDD